MGIDIVRLAVYWACAAKLRASNSNGGLLDHGHRVQQCRLHRWRRRRPKYPDQSDDSAVRPGRKLYVTEQNGTINVLTVGLQAGKYVATSAQVVNSVKNIQNHNDDGTNYLPATQTRQLTGMLVTGTAANPVIYATSSDPRISSNADANLDTNSGVLTKLTCNGSAWNAVDLIRGLPRSEQNHAPNGMALSPDGNTLYMAVGATTNNGAPSSFFANTAEYALSASILAVNLPALMRCR